MGKAEDLLSGRDICTILGREFHLVREESGILDNVHLVGGEDHRLGSFSQSFLDSREPVGGYVLKYHAERLLVFSRCLWGLTQRTVSLLV